MRDLYDRAGISTVLVAGSSGAFFHVADTVIQMDAYRPLDVREKVARFLPEYPLPAFEADAFALPCEDRAFWGKPVKQGAASSHRSGRGYGRDDRPDNDGSENRSANRGREERIKTKVMSTDGFSLNHDTVDLRYVEQLIDSEQTAALAKMMKYVLTHLSGTVSVDRLAKMLAHQIEQDGLEPFMDGYGYCGLAMPRVQEIYAMLNRDRG